MARKKKPRRKPFPKAGPGIRRAGASKEQGAYNELVRSKLAELLERPSDSSEAGKRESRKPKRESQEHQETQLERILQAAIHRAEHGETAARRDVLEWFAGKPVQPIEASGPG
ncbi:MAG TPA: hypothetical protein VHM88_08370, partial [Candidatus Acidoferrales bacterium]|nr:hypothetical protein [Candidatus Acidoferrales bacterium]